MGGTPGVGSGSAAPPPVPHVQNPNPKGGAAAAAPMPKPTPQLAQAVVAEARKNVGSADWSAKTARAPYGAGTNKCNLFVFETLNKAGTPVPLQGRIKWKGLTDEHLPPLAGDWANPKANIKGWDVVKNPQPGDVAAQKEFYLDASGHVGIVVAPGKTVSASSITDRIEENDWGFRKEQQDQVVFRRYVGDAWHPIEPKFPTSGRNAL